jgi:uncharacterized protein YvpB
MKVSTAILGFLVIGSSVGSSLITTARERPLTPSAGRASLAFTGSGTVRVIRPHSVEPVTLAPSITIYTREVPAVVPPVSAAPVSTIRIVPARPWTPPVGYAVIPVPIYRQAMALDCETGALRMGLATFGHYFSDAALFAYESPDLRAPIMGANHAVIQWGDPYTNFVGNVNGRDTAPTGYGIYWPVILSIARSHGLPHASGGEGYAPGTIYAALTAGHPVEVWVESYWERPAVRTWTAWDGRQVRYSLIEHAVVLSGVSGSQVRVNDPLHGTQYWISKSLFETNWRDFNDMAVIFQ